MTTSTTAAAKTSPDRFVTNVWEPNRTSPRRAKLTADGSGNLMWCSLYTSTGDLIGCGPSLVGLDGALLDAATDRLSHVPAKSPMYWKPA